MSKVTICGIEAGPKERVYGTLPVTTMANGSDLSIPVHILNGANPGPRILLTAVSHGDATTGLEVIRQVLESVNLEELSGTVIAVPCQNPIGFEWDSRNTPIDMYNMNRTYPGNPRGWFTEQMAAAVSSLCKEADYLIDWHGGGYGTAINYVLLKIGHGESDEKVKELGFVYGLEHLYGGPPAGPKAAYTGTLTDYMLSLGKPAIVAEVGTGMQLSIDIVAGSVRGTLNIMKHVGMYPGKPELPKVQYLIKERPLIRPQKGGLFYPECGPELLNKSVPKGTLMARVRNPLTLKTIEEIYAPCEETVFLSMRGLLTKVHPG
ncbi:MAG TPA: succinylglutamate desuccinylase/aspartoacylase family protein, partial [Corynebacteriales bacterium]|nr:succinylglutamate desuccinylase/aspartoacylase family protein [Mycobacteriales bacterium]